VHLRAAASPLSVLCLTKRRRKKKTYAVIKRQRVGVVEGKTGRPNLKQSREVHVGRNPSNLTAKLTLGLTLQVFETSRGGL
jgi:hypothetical protein